MQLVDAAQNFNTLWRPDHVLRVGYDGYGYNADPTNVMHSPWNGEMYASLPLLTFPWPPLIPPSLF